MYSVFGPYTVEEVLFHGLGGDSPARQAILIAGGQQQYVSWQAMYQILESDRATRTPNVRWYIERGTDRLKLTPGRAAFVGFQYAGDPEELFLYTNDFMAWRARYLNVILMLVGLFQ